MNAGTLVWLDPWFLLLVPALLALLLLRLGRASAALPSASLAAFAGLPQGLRARLVWLPQALLTLGGLGLALALARPTSRELLPLREAGIDLLLVVDISSSMRANDMDEAGKRTRIAAAVEKATEFARARPHDRVGLLTFARFPELICPPTLDQDALGRFLAGVRTVTPNSEEDRTAIGVALARAVDLLGKSKARSRVVVLLSDGENNVPDIEPEAAAKLAKDRDVRVHAIGVGNGAPDPFGRMHPLAFTALQTIAETSGGRFFRAESEADLRAVYAGIDRMEKVELEDPRYRTTELFLLPMLAGIALAALGLLLDLAWLRGVP